MAIRKRGDSWQIDYLDPGGKRVRQSFKTRKEAAAEFGKRVSLIAEGRYDKFVERLKCLDTTLADLCRRYEENFSVQSNFNRGKRKYLSNFKESFGEMRLLHTITFADVETYRNQLRQRPVVAIRNGVEVVRGLRKDASVNREMACLHHLFRKAVQWKMLEKSPFDGEPSLKLKENNKRMRFLNEDEIERLLSPVRHTLSPLWKRQLIPA